MDGLSDRLSRTLKHFSMLHSTVPTTLEPGCLGGFTLLFLLLMIYCLSSVIVSHCLCVTGPYLVMMLDSNESQHFS